MKKIGLKYKIIFALIVFSIYLFLFNNVSEATEEKIEQPLENGIYMIKSAINPKFMLDVNGASKDNGANVQLYEYSNVNQKKFKLTYEQDGYYTIIAMHSNKSLDVKDASKEKGANVWQWEANGTDAQKWKIKDNKDGTYSIISKCNGLYVDVLNARAANFTNIQMCDGNGLNAQKFKFEKTTIDSSNNGGSTTTETEIKGTKTIEDGTYMIKSSIDSKFMLDINGASKDNGANVQLYEYSDVAQKKFKVTYLGDGFYSIIASHSDKSLDVENSSKKIGTNVRQWEYTGADSQKWVIKDNKDGTYSIISKCNGLYIDVFNAQARNFTNIQMCNSNGLNAQKFKFVKANTTSSGGTTGSEDQNPPAIKGTKTVEDGVYAIRSSINPRFVLEVAGASQYNSANVQLYEYAAGNQKRFKVTYEQDGYYSIIAMHSNKSLDVKDASRKKGTNVWQWEANGTDAQKWVIKDNNDGTYSIISKCNGLYVDVFNANATNSTNIQMCDGNGLKAQKFIFAKIGTASYSEGKYGVTGLKVANRGGSDLKYYKYGSGENVFFATFAIHGFEDAWDRDGQELVTMANNFYRDLINRDDSEIAKKWTIYIFPGINLDGLNSGWTNNGPGRTTLYSYASQNKGIDMNRCWQVGNSYTRYTDNRNYNGTAGFQAPEAASLRDFLLQNKSKNGQTVLVDLHGWTQQLIGDPQICSIYQGEFPENNTNSVGRYGQGYLINWARVYLGSNGRNAKSSLIELPNYGDTVRSHQDVIRNLFYERYFISTINMLYAL